VPNTEAQTARPPALAVRPATPQDVAAIQQLNDEVLGCYLVPEVVQAQLKVILSDAAQHVLVAQSGLHRVGYLHMYTSLSTFLPPAAEILSIAVHPAWQGRGIGGRLLFYGEMWARRQNLYTLRLGCDTQRRLTQAFCLKNGFEETGSQGLFAKNIPKYPHARRGERPRFL
jgi:GNAT superfamily N-acetyltransferase